MRSVLDEFLEEHSGTWIPPEDAERLFLGESCQVKDLDDEHLIQLVLCSVYSSWTSERSEVSKLRVEKEVQVGVERMQRRMASRHKN